MEVYRNGTAVNFVNTDKNTVYTHEVMGVHEIRCAFISQEALDIRVDDYILFRGDRYSINVEFSCRKVSNFEYHYDIVFEHYVYWMKDKIFRHLGAVEFSYFGTAAAFVSLVAGNMNEVDTGWSVGRVDATEGMNIQFYGEERGFTCKGALMKIAEEFGLEFWLTGKTIHMTRQAGSDTNLDFEYGRGRGLYSVTRGALETPLYNRIYGYGGNKNIPYTYRNGAKRLMFEGNGLERPLATGERRRETSVIFDDIYPKRTGTLTAVSGDWLDLSDTSLNFDLNGERIEGEEAKVVFLSGELAGKEFEIDTYDHSSKKIKIVPFIEEDGYTTPNATFGAKAGDKYTLVGIKLPQSYVTEAEALLRAKTQDVFNQLSRPPYQVEVDPKYMRDNAITVKAGDRVRLKDPDLSIDDMIRVTSVSFPLVAPDEVTFVISDRILYTQEVLQEIDKNRIQTEIVVVDRTKAELARRNMLHVRRLQGLVFDPDGYFDPENIRPLSIETAMLSVGAKSQNFGLNGVAINTNTGGNPNHLTVGAGSLIHYEIDIPGLGYAWQSQGKEFTGLNASKSYYLSARCSVNALTGEWHLSETPMGTESEPGYYHFNIGVLYDVIDGYRGFDFTKGMTFIVGDTITTGRIQSLDKLNFFDLSQGTFKIGDEDQSLDWGVTAAGQLTINGALVADMIMADGARIRSLIVESLKTSVSGQRMEILKEENNLKFYDRDGNLVLAIDDDIDSALDEQSGMFTPRSGIRATAGVRNTSYMSANGLLSNASGYSFLPIHMGVQTNASVVGVLSARNTGINGISAAVAGIDATSDGNSRSYGGYFSSLLTGSLSLRTQTITGSVSIIGGVFFSCYNQSGITVTLPADPDEGAVMYFTKINDYAVTLDGNGKSFAGDPVAGSVGIVAQWSTLMVRWDGSYWITAVMPGQ